MFTTIESYSNEFTILANEETIDVTTVSFENVKEGSLLIIKDIDGITLYSEQIEKTGTYTKRFDLTNLPDAKYYFELDTQEEIAIFPFYIEANIAEFVKEEAYTIVKPEVVAKDDFVYISNNSLEYQSLKIDVFYEGYDLAYSEKIKDVASLNRIYDFSNSKKGNYDIVFSFQGRSFSNSINIP